MQLDEPGPRPGPVDSTDLLAPPLVGVRRPVVSFHSLRFNCLPYSSAAGHGCVPQPVGACMLIELIELESSMAPSARGAHAAVILQFQCNRLIY